MTLHNVLDFLASFKGRTSRRDFAVSFISLSLVGSLVAFFSPYFMLLIIPILVITARRLHDMNLSGWWQILAHSLVFIALSCHITWVIVLYLYYQDKLAQGLLVCAWFMIGLYAVFWIALSCVRGTKGPNKYGPDPLQKDNTDNMAVAP